jgi:hypothetical protein
MLKTRSWCFNRIFVYKKGLNKVQPHKTMVVHSLKEPIVVALQDGQSSPDAIHNQQRAIYLSSHIKTHRVM